MFVHNHWYFTVLYNITYTKRSKWCMISYISDQTLNSRKAIRSYNHKPIYSFDISGPSLGAKAKFLSFNRTQSRVVSGLLKGHNTLLGLLDNPLCRMCRVQEETSAHILCKYEALASLRHAHLGSFFLEPEDIKNISLGAIWNFCKVIGFP